MAIPGFARGVLLAIPLAGQILALSPPSPPAFAPARPQGDRGFAAANVDRFLAKAAEEIGGGSGLLLLRDGKVLYLGAAGGLDLDRPLKIASATKWLTGAVLLSLADDGKLALDDPVLRYLPDFAGDKAGITVRHLLSHTSGLPMTHTALTRRDVSLREAVDAIATSPLIFAPLEAMMYGDVSFQVAGRIAEVVSGQTWSALFASRLAEPLGMTATAPAGELTANPHLAGGAVSSAADYANFLVMLLDEGEFRGRRVLSRTAVGEMLRDQTGGSPLRFNPFELFPELHPGWRDVRYGIGNWLEVVNRATATAVEASAPGVFGFCPWIDVRRNLAGVFIAETRMEKSLPLYLRLKTLLRAELPMNTADRPDRRQ